ncbi:MAG: DUF3298 and DUF4163 domain-containing protein [Ignavibacteriales bacterium]|nr:DUF3298 and DUF4163 domain-containing protein [Ignavibacteriales bacterium]
MKKLFVLFAILIFANNLKALNLNILLTDTLEIKTSNYNNSTADSSVWINIDYPQITGLKNIAVELKINRFLEDEFKQSIPWYDEIQSDSSYYEDVSYDMQYSFETGYTVEYNSEKFVSVVLNHYQFTGGAHGNYFALGYNIKTSDGKNLTLKDIIKSDSFDILTDECEQSILESYQTSTLIEAGLFEDEIVLEDDQDFYITPTSLIVQFDPYEIGPYAMGEIMAEIPFKKIKDILKDNLPFPTN